MEAPAEASRLEPRKRGFLPGVRRALTPVREARGIARVMLWAGAGITLAFILMAFLAPVISPYRFDQYLSGGERFPQLASPSGKHLLGTTVQSTDVLSRVIWGSQTELKVVLVSLALSLSVGVPLGLISGYFAGPLDRVLVLIMDA